MKQEFFSDLRDRASRIKEQILRVTRSTRVVLFHLWGVTEKRRTFTEQYPDPVSSKTEDDLPSKFRGILFNDIERCTGCGECVAICPSQCIVLETEKSPEAPTPWVRKFEIDLGRCLFCGLCVSGCEPASLIHTKQFEGAVYLREDLVSSYGRGALLKEANKKWN